MKVRCRLLTEGRHKCPRNPVLMSSNSERECRRLMLRECADMTTRLIALAGSLAVLLMLHCDADPRAEVNGLIFDDSLVLLPAGETGFEPSSDK